jgi:hypothetical protein
MSAECNVKAGQHVEVAWSTGNQQFVIPVIFQNSFNNIDQYWGTVTNVNFPIVSGLQFLLVAGDYVASGGNGAQCYVSYTYMPPAS